MPIPPPPRGLPIIKEADGSPLVANARTLVLASGLTLTDDGNGQVTITPTAASHTTLSATHTDSFAADTPVDGDVLTWVNANNRWEAVQPPGAGSGAPTTASYVTVDTETGLSAEYVLGSAVIMRGTFGARPAASKAGLLYADTTNNLLYRDNGSSWDTIAGVYVFAPTDATYVTLDANGSLSAEAVLGTAVIMRGTFAGRPAASKAGLLYFASDTGNGYRDNGSSWDLIAAVTAPAHNLLSASHGDVFAADTPADGDALMWVAANSRWEAAPPPGAGTGAPTTSPYVTTATDATLTNEKVLGTTIIPTAAYASRPAAAIAGAIFIPTDGFYFERDDGSAWKSFGPIFPITPPVSGDFAWVNQGSSTLVTANGGINLSTPAVSAANARIRKKAAPSTPWTIEAMFIPQIHRVDNNQCGLIFRQSSDGKLVSFACQSSSSLIIFNVTKWNSETTFPASPNYVLNTQYMQSPIWFKIQDNGTSRICSWSTDGVNYIQVHSIGRTDHLTADEVGFFVNSQNSAVGCGMTLLSWKQS